MYDSYKNTRVHEKLNIIWGVKLMQIKIGIYRNISSYMYVLYLQIYISKKTQINAIRYVTLTSQLLVKFDILLISKYRRQVGKPRQTDARTVSCKA